jgi:zinc protease
MQHRSAEQISTTELGPRPLPSLGAPRTPSAPSAVDTVLDSGLRVIAVRRPAVPMVELHLEIPFGGTQRTHPARAEVLAMTLLRGTPRRNRFDIDKALAEVGGDLSAGVDPEHLSVSGSALASGLDVVLDVLGNALTSASYATAEVAREKDRLVERLTMNRSQPHVIAREALQRRRYGNHPFAREWPEVDDDLQLVHREGAVQSQLRLSAQAVSRTHERYPALQVANLVFGGYFSSRWVENVREAKGYTYAAHCGFEFTQHGATLIAEADTASEVTAAALLETRYELGRLVVVPPDDSEVDSAREYAIGSLTIATASQRGLAGHLTTLATLGLDLDWLLSHTSRLRTVTTGQVAEAAAEFFAPTRFTGVVVGDGKRLADPLAALGGVELP